MIISTDQNRSLERLSDKPKMAWWEQGWVRVLSRDRLPRQPVHLNHTGFFLGRNHGVTFHPALTRCVNLSHHISARWSTSLYLESSRGWNLTTPPQSLFHMVMSWGQKSTENVVTEFQPQFCPSQWIRIDNITKSTVLNSSHNNRITLCWFIHLVLFLSTLYRLGSWGTERESDLPKFLEVTRC